jgi:hypothetical protein
MTSLGFPAIVAAALLGAASEKASTTTMIIGMKSGETQPDGERETKEGRLAFEVASLAIRYHFIATGEVSVGTENAQHLSALKARLRLSERGRATIHAGVFPGARFRSGWNDTGWGTGETGFGLYLKQLYLSAAPAPGVEAQWGGLAVEYGESTEVTSYDFDGYLTGERLILRHPRRLFFDEVSLSLGYLSASEPPGIFDRLDRLDDVNYTQLLVLKTIGRRTRISADYTRHAGTGTVRQAAHVETPGFLLTDALRFEGYERLGEGGGYGCNLYGQKRPFSRLSVGAGLARVDRSLLNADRFPAGTSLYQNAHFTINSELSVMAGFTRTFGAREPIAPRTRLDVALGVNLVPRLGSLMER